MKLWQVQSILWKALRYRSDGRSAPFNIAMFLLFLSAGWPVVPALGQSGLTTPDTTLADSTASTKVERITTRPLYGSGMGFAVVVTNSGFGLGGYYSKAIDDQNSILAELNIGAEKSEREVKFLGFGQSFIPDKANYFVRMPIQFGLQRRLWHEYIEDNFRPFLQVTAGPTLGWIYPYFDDDNGNGRYDSEERRYDGFGSFLKGEFRLGFGGTLGIGANFGEKSRLTQGVRIAYSFNYFFETVQLLELDDQFAPANFFGTPSISITFGKLF